MTEKLLTGLLIALGALALIVLLGGVFALFVKLLWNGCLVGAIDGVHEITFLQAWGLNILSGFLFSKINLNSGSK